MSDNYDYDIDELDGPPSLRDHAKDLKKQLADLQKKFADSEKARAVAEKAAKSQSITSLLRDKGVKPGLAKFLEKDEVEPTAEAVDAWLKENGEFFNVQPAKADEEVTDSAEDEPTGEPNIPDGMEAAIRASQGLDASGLSPSEVSLLSKIQSVDTDPSRVTEDQLVESLRALGVDLT